MRGVDKVEEQAKEYGAVQIERKMIIIKTMAWAMANRMNLKDGLLHTIAQNSNEELFVSKLYDEMKEYIQNYNGAFNLLAEKMKLDMYDRFEIPLELQQQEAEQIQAKNAATQAYLDEQKEKWSTKDTQEDIAYELTSNQSNEGYYQDLFKPEYLYQSEKDGRKMPLIKLVKEPTQNITDNQYEIDGTQYIIRKIGSLAYLTALRVEEAISEYEIIIRRGEKEFVTRKFGNILISEMGNKNYSKAVFEKLLGRENLQDRNIT